MSKEEEFMDKERRNILIERYMDGETTNAEEQELREAMEAPTDLTAPSSSPKGERSRGDGDEFEEEQRMLRALFAFEEQERAAIQAGRSHCTTISLPPGGVGGGLRDFRNSTISLPLGGVGGSRKVGGGLRRLRRFDMFLASAAASAAVLFAIAIGTQSHGPRDYAIVDGKMYTDKEVMAREAEEALMMVSSSEDDTFDALMLMQ